MFSCRVCAEKQKRIDDLKAQVEMLSKLVFVSSPSQDLSTSAREIDALLNGEHGPLEEMDEVSREANLVLSSIHDESGEF